MNYEVNINNFEGPLDLLLHLIKESNINIYNIKIDEITKQYLDYLKIQEELNLSIASEYLVMAAELIEMKSKLLLPKKEIEKDEEEIDDREELINKLLEYEKYKNITSALKDLEIERSILYTKSPSNLKNYIDNNTDINIQINIEDLALAFSKYLERKKEEKPLNTRITKKEYSVRERCQKIKDILIKKKKINFEELFENYTKPYVVVTFLSVLEMIKNKEIVLVQNNNFDDIVISLRGDDYE